MQPYVVGLGFICQTVALFMRLGVAFLIVRSLPKEEYAWYATCWQLIGAGMTVSNSGVQALTLGIGGAVSDDPKRLSTVIFSALSVRRWNWTAVLVACVPVLWVLLTNQGCPSLGAISLAALFVMATHLQLTLNTLGIVPRLRESRAYLLLFPLLSEALRLALMLAILHFVPKAAAALLIWVVLLAALIEWTRRTISEVVPRKGPGDAQIERRMRRETLRQLPGSIYAALNGVLSIALLTLLASSASVADLGAISRVSLIYASVLPTLASFVMPRIAKATTTDNVRRAYLVVALTLCTIGVAGIAAVWLFTGEILHVFGPSYAGLDAEVRLAVSIGAFSMLASGLYDVVAARGVLANSAYLVTCTVALQICLISLLDMSMVFNVIMLGIAQSFVTLAASLILIRRMHSTAMHGSICRKSTEPMS